MAWFRRFFVGRRNYSSNSNTNLSLQLTSALFTSAPEGGILTLSRAGGFLNEKLTAQEVEEIRSVFKEHSIIAEVTFTENNLQLLHAQMMEVVMTNEAAKRAPA